MSAKVMLPDFNFPGQAPHPAVRALWAAGGLVVVATVILGGALWHRHAVDQAAREATAQVLAATSLRLVAEVKPAAAAPTVPAAAAIPAGSPSAGGENAAAPSAPALEHVSRHHGIHHGSHALRSRTLAKSGSQGSKKSGAKKDDAIDRLLHGFK